MNYYQKYLKYKKKYLELKKQSGGNDEDFNLVKTFNDHSRSVNSVAFSPDCKWLASGSNDKTVLYKTKDGMEYNTLLTHIRPPGDKSNEHALSFDRNGKAYMLLRRDKPQAGNATNGLLGMSEYPYIDWEWKRMPIRIGGPAMVVLPNGRLLACVRRYLSGGNKTELGFIDPDNGDYTPALRLPSNGDTSYAGMVIQEDKLWVSYYSSHQSKSAIYLAKLKIP